MKQGHNRHHGKENSSITFLHNRKVSRKNYLWN